MRLLVNIIVVFIFFVVILMSGCSLIQDQPPSGENKIATGNDLIITEVFTIPPDRYYAYSWIEIYNPTNKTIPWRTDLHPVYAYCSGTNGTILKTTDDGRTWTDSSSNSSLPIINSIGFPIPDTGFAVGDHRTVLKVYNGGVNDLSTRTYTTVPSDVNFNAVGIQPYYQGTVDVRARLAFVVGDRGTFIRTTDAGATWKASALPNATSPTTNSLRAIAVAQPRIFVVGDSGSFFYSKGLGSSWLSRTIPEPFRKTNFYGVTFVGDTGWAVGENGSILVSRNTGTTSEWGNGWLPETSNVSATLRSVFFPLHVSQFKVGNGWAVGDSGTIIRTENSGETWTSVESGTTSRLNSVVFADSARGWIFGEGGLVLTTDDEGLTWVRQASHTTNDLKSGAILPLLINVQNFYVLQMYGKRSYVFFDLFTGTLNTDYITKVDTGYLLYAPPPPDVRNPNFKPVNQAPGTFVILSNDSVKFQDHTKLGPGSTRVLNFTLAVDSSTISSGIPALLKWDLLSSSEIQLLKIYLYATETKFQIVTKIVDVVRFGGFRPAPDLYPNNVPAGFIPEYWSLSRYNDDILVDPNIESTNKSFYMAKNPIPGWFSQERKPK